VFTVRVRLRCGSITPGSRFADALITVTPEVNSSFHAVMVINASAHQLPHRTAHRRRQLRLGLVLGFRASVEFNGRSLVKGTAV